MIKPVFDKKIAPIYDERNKKLTTFKNALHLTLEFAFQDLPQDARILCVGT